MGYSSVVSEKSNLPRQSQPTFPTQVDALSWQFERDCHSLNCSATASGHASRRLSQPLPLLRFHDRNTPQHSAAAVAVKQWCPCPHHRSEKQHHSETWVVSTILIFAGRHNQHRAPSSQLVFVATATPTSLYSLLLTHPTQHSEPARWTLPALPS